MIKKYREIIVWIIAIISIACGVVPLIYWLYNPELTYMEIILKFWYIYPIAAITYIINNKLSKL